MSRIKKYLRPKPVVLITIEGWGVAPLHPGNILQEASWPHLLDVMSHYPAMSLTSGHTDGSEYGHMLLGLGHIPLLPKAHIDAAIENNIFQEKLESVAKTIGTGSLHLITLVTHAQNEVSFIHLLEIIEWAKKALPKTKVYIHAILDGRDTSSKAGRKVLQELEEKLGSQMQIVSLCGRMYALDLYGHTSRLERAIAVMTKGEGNQAASASQALEDSYEKKIFDEEVAPTAIKSEANEATVISDNDTVLFCHFNPIAIRPLVQFLTLMRPTIHYVSLGSYEVESVAPLFEIPQAAQTLGEIISSSHYRQLRIADSEGYPFITAALNGGKDSPYPLEERHLVPLVPNENYLDSLLEGQTQVTKEALKAITENRHDFIALTFSGLDRLGHTGNIKDVMEIMTALDTNVGKIVKTVIEHDGVAVIVGTHGLVEQLSLNSGEGKYEHTNHPVPFIIAGKPLAGRSLGVGEPVGGDLSTIRPVGSLVDVAPTILTLMRLPIPPDMTGKSLFNEQHLV